MSDLPDFQSATDIARQDLAYLVIDLAKQTLATLAVDIKAQTLDKLAVNIAAQTLSQMAVNITAQDLAQLVIKIAAQTVGVYLQPEWAALQGTDKNFSAQGTNKVFQEIVSGSYLVPPGKTLYVNTLAFVISASVAENADLNQMGQAEILDNLLQRGAVGGNGGGALVFPIPVVVAAEHTFYWVGTCKANHACNIGVIVKGYELDA